ncbi:MAG TPA: phosphate ABC transporter permease subunit PstC [Fimbriimonadaceae bacterium]|nr:phosphate ABC transporter permease subunit PstC [Fimbriimonadaceae bacterium]
MKRRKFKEWLIDRVIFAGGLASILFVVLILAFLLKEGLPLFATYSPGRFFTGREWQPTLPPPAGPGFGLLPNLWGSFLVTLGAAVLAIPLGLATAVYMGRIAPNPLGEFLKGTVEMLGVVPSVALGFIGAVVVTPLLKDWLDLDTGKSAIAGAAMLAFLAIPTIATIADDAIASVPREYEQASLALGATKWQTIARVLLPASRPGIIAAIMLGLGRAIGETMVVIMVTGNAGLLPDRGIWYAFTHSVRTITGTIGAEALEVATGEPHYHALFMLGLVLLCITLVFNAVANKALGLKRTVRA